MSAVIIAVEDGSPAQKAGFRSGDRLISVGGHPVGDVLDLQFYSYEARLQAEIEREGEIITLNIRKHEGEELGLEFETYLIDRPRSCANKCVFCFIDQMPGGMRESLYFKDDDSRLSFLTGNYVTLTNMSESEVRRIIDMRLGPINVSIHTTDPDLRVKMLSNRRAGDALRFLRMMADAGIRLNGQIVLCPGLNDGEALKRTLSDLMALRPALESVSIVPVGLTKFREGLAKLRPLTAEDARAVLSIVDDFAARCRADGGGSLFFCSDEIYMLVGREFPPVSYYEDFPQYENGVGMAPLFLADFNERLEELSPDTKAEAFIAVTGKLFYPLLSLTVDLLLKKCHNISGGTDYVDNRFFGEQITVAGLITGSDLLEKLRHKSLPPRIIIPSSMLRAGEHVFLDDVTCEDIENALGVRVEVTPGGGAELIDTILGIN